MKKLLSIITILAAFTTNIQAADNTIYIDQAGDNATITILQDGAGNRVRGIQGVGTGNTTPAKLNGDAITVDIQQVGSGNILNMGVVTTTANGSSPTNIVYNLTESQIKILKSNTISDLRIYLIDSYLDKVIDSKKAEKIKLAVGCI